MSVSCQASMMTIGHALFGLDKKNEIEIDLCCAYGRQIMMLDVSVMDRICKHYADDHEALYQFAGWKDDNLNPITIRMRNLLEATQNSIA
jgi:hypothetical protein